MLQGRLLAQRAVRSYLVVVSPLSFAFGPGVAQAEEPVGVQQLSPDSAVEGLGEGVVRRLSRPAEVHDEAVLPGPEIDLFCG